MSATTTRRKKSTKKRAYRHTSNVFSMFHQSQIQEFKVRITKLLPVKTDHSLNNILLYMICLLWNRRKPST